MYKILENKDFLNLLLQTHPIQRKWLIKTADKNQVNSLNEVLLNAWLSREELDKSSTRLLEKHKKFMKRFSHKEKARNVKRAYYIRHNKILSSLLETLKLPLRGFLLNHVGQ